MPRHSSSADLVTLLAALADPTRLRLLNLMAGREVCVCYFVEILGQSQPKISRHLAYLRRAGLVRSRREGKWMHYSILPPANVTVLSTLDTVLAGLKQDKVMQADLTRLPRVACCAPQHFVTLEHAPVPSPR